MKKTSIYIAMAALMIFGGCKDKDNDKPEEKMTVTTLAGSGIAGFADGAGADARFNHPSGIDVDAAGNVYVADAGNNRIRKISPVGVVSTLAGSTEGLDEGTGTDAQFFNPTDVAVDAAGNVYVADMNNHKIRKITSEGVVSRFAGSGIVGDDDGTVGLARFYNPSHLTVDAAGNLYVVDVGNYKIRKISSGEVTTLAGNGTSGYADGAGATAQFHYPSGVAVDAAGNVYVADGGNSRIRKITAGVVFTLAGGAEGNVYGHIIDGTGAAARFISVQGGAFDAAGNLYAGDSHYIRKITPAGVVTTLVGSDVKGFADGTGSEAQFETNISGVAVNATGTIIYVADTDNNRIRKITIKE